MASLQSVTVEYVVSGSLDGTTPAPRIVIDQNADDPTPFGVEDQIYRVEVENLGLIDPDLGVGGSIGPRCIPFLWIATEAVGEVAAAAEVVGVIAGDDSKRQRVVADLAGDAGGYLNGGIMVPQGSAIRLSGFTAGAEPIVVRVSIIAPEDCLDFTLAALTLTEETAPPEPPAECCRPTYIYEFAWFGNTVPDLRLENGRLAFAASTCGQVGPLTGKFLPVPGIPTFGQPTPVVTSVEYDPVLHQLEVLYEPIANSPFGSSWMLEITNACGCCTIVPVRIGFPV